MTIRRDNTSGYPGVSFKKKARKWRVTISINKKQTYVGTYKSLEEAVDARKEAELKYYGESQKMRSDNTSGCTGVYFHKKSGRWMVQISINRKTIYLGLYGTFEEAVEIRKEAERKYYGNYTLVDSSK